MLDIVISTGARRGSAVREVAEEIVTKLLAIVGAKAVAPIGVKTSDLESHKLEISYPS